MKKFVFLTSFVLLTLTLVITINACKNAPTDAEPIITKITGKVVSDKTGNPIGAVKITTTPATATVLTGSDGTYTITDISAGQYTINAEKEGYNTGSSTITIKEGQTLNADISLKDVTAELAVSTETLDLGTTQASMNLYITNKNKIGTVTWQAKSNQSWLTVTPTDGTTTTESDAISVSVDRTSLPYGNYTGVVTITSDFGTKTINVLVTKQNPNAPQLTVSPTALDYSSALTTQSITIKNTGTGTLNWTASKSDNWILLSSNSGTLNADGSITLNITVDRNGLAQNNYTGSVTVSSNGGSQIVAAKMNVPSGSTVTGVTLGNPESVTSNSATLKWSEYAGTDFKEYRVYYSTTPDVTTGSSLATTITNKSTTSYNITGLTGGTVYYFRVYVVNTNNLNGGSNLVNCSTDKQLGTWVSTTTLSGLNVKPNCLFPVSDNLVWAVGDEIWKFNGISWAKDLKPSGIGTLRAVYFVNSSLGYAVGANGTFIKYNGTAWSNVTGGIWSSSESLSDVVATSANNIWISSGTNNGTFYHWDGTNWTKSTVQGYKIWDIDIQNTGTIYATDYWGKVFKYNGTGWSNVCSIQSGSYYQISSVGDFVATASGEFSTFDGTKVNSTFTGKADGKNYSSWYAYSTYAISSTEVWFAKDYINFYNGTNVQSFTSPVKNTINCIKMLNSNSGWAVSSAGEILRYKL